MEVSRRIQVPTTAERLWEIVTDLPAVLSCLPGAAVGEPTADGYNATITAQAGEFTATFAGVATLAVLDGTGRSVAIRASGQDGLGSLRSTAQVLLRVEQDEQAAGQSILDLHAQFDFSGLFAPAARAAGGPAAGALVKRFAANLVTRAKGG